MYRIKYLLGIFSSIFGALYLLFGIVGFEDAMTDMDRWTAFVLCGVHLVIGLALMFSSLRDKRRHDVQMNELVDSLLLIHPSLSAELFAKEAGMSVPDAHDFLERSLHSRKRDTNAA